MPRHRGEDVAKEYYFFVDEKYGYYVKCPFLYNSDNGGKSWNKLSEFCPEYIYFITPDIGWASDDGILYKTTDGALNWEEELNDHENIYNKFY